MTTVLPIKIQTDSDECGLKCPFLQQDTEAGIIQCTLFVEVLNLDFEESRIVPIRADQFDVPVHIYRCDPCTKMESL